MATNTARLAMRKPDTTDLVNVLTDIDATLDTLDNNPGCFIAVNAAALPGAGNWQGRLAYQVDTNLYLTWTGAAWVALPGQVLARSKQIVNGTAGSLVHDAGVSFQIVFTMPTLGTGRYVEIDMSMYYINYTVAPAAGTLTYAFILCNGATKASTVGQTSGSVGSVALVKASLDNTDFAAGVAVTAKCNTTSTSANNHQVAADAGGPFVLSARIV